MAGMGPIERCCPDCGHPGYVLDNGERLCGWVGCDRTEPIETGVEMVTVPAADYQGAVEVIERIARHPSGTTRAGEAMRRQAREWLEANPNLIRGL
jgi:hypothetical protein